MIFIIIRKHKHNNPIPAIAVILLLCFGIVSCSKQTSDISQDIADNHLSDTVSAVPTEPAVTETITPVITELPQKADEERGSGRLPSGCAAIIYITINPEMALYINSEGKVISVQLLNEDAAAAYTYINFLGKTVEESTELVIEAAIEHKFLTEEKQVKFDVAVIDTSIDAEAITTKAEEKVNETVSKHEMEVEFVGSEIREDGKILCPECFGSGICAFCSTLPPCDKCGGTGNCSFCEEGYEICPACGGNTSAEQTGPREVEYCLQCGSPVSVTDQICPICNGTGVADCHMCRGKGYNACTACNGKGYHEGTKQQYDGPCPACGGTGCAVCNGSGEKFTIITNPTCEECNGTKINKCNECDGTGHEKEPCSIYCNHPGDRHEFRTVEGPIGDTDLCHTCEGQGRMLCSVCHGEYTSGCTTCEGTGRTLCRACTENGLHIRGVCARCLGTGLTDPQDNIE